MAESEDVNVNLSEIIPTDMSSVAEIEIPSLEGEQSNEATPTTSGNKRKRQSRGPHESKDPNAPRRPQTAYMMFTNDVRKDVRSNNPETTVSERAKMISRMWAELDDDKKKVYQERAQEDKERFIQEYVAYQETESYQKFIHKKFPALSKKLKTEDEKSEPSPVKASSTPAKPASTPGKTPLSCQQQYVPGLNIPIFSDEFLKHNREMESKLRKLRQSSSNLEEENALLSRHVESMKNAVLRVQKEVKKQEEKNGKLQSHLVMLREILVSMFKDVPLPGTGELPTVDTIDNYMGKLQLAISTDPDKYPDLLVKVAEIAKQLETVLKPRLEQDGLSIPAAEEGGGTSEDGQ